MTDAIYNEFIVRTARDRSHAGRLEGPDRSLTRDNPLCGDRVTLDLKLDAASVAVARHKTRGCLLTEAAATLVAAHATGLDPSRAAALVPAVRAFLAGDAPPPWPELAMFEPVRAVRSRHECVLLPFETLAEALQA